MKTAAVIGSGLMGTGIARHLAESGLHVMLLDNAEAQLIRAEEDLHPLTVGLSTDFRELSGREFVIEAVFESLEVKRDVLTKASQTVDESCIIATNTSSLLIRDLATTVHAPQRFLGVHYNNPADLNPVVEIIPGAETGEDVVLSVQTWMKANGKHALRCADTHCFILNRQSLPYINEAARCLAIATPGEIDFVATHKLGSGMGPFAVMNLVGLPVMAAASGNLAILGAGYQPASILQQRAESGEPWQIDQVEQVGKETISTLVKRLRGAMLFPGKDILNNNLCSRDDLHKICVDALGYEKSSPELIEVLKPHIVEQLISDYLQQF